MPGLFRCFAKPMLIKPAPGRSVVTPLTLTHCRLIQRTSALSRPQSRSIVSVKANRNGARRTAFRGADPLAVTWLARNPSEVTTDHIIPNLPILPPTSNRQHNVPVFLVTPAFAPWIDTTHPFLKDSIGHIFQEVPAVGNKGVQAVVAVIDQLPSPQSRRAEQEPEDTASFEDGSEGLSLLLVDKNHLTGEAAKESGERGALPAEPVMTYSVQPLQKEGKRLVSHEVGFRLANTLFVNGSHRTIFASDWRHDPASDSLTLKRRLDLSSCQISSIEEPQVSLQVPLHPVTQRRKVLFSMGNILRQISKGDGSEESIPASAELEKELPRYVRENNLTNQRLVVWALIEPASTVGNSGSANEMDDNHVPTSIRNGARLHRVVSGGGGWGKKKGLLSLDPETQFTGDRSPTLSGLIGDILEGTSVQSGDEKMTAGDKFSNEFPGFGESEITSINQVAKDGEFVQFFVAAEGAGAGFRANPSESASKITDYPDISQNSAPQLTCTFGAISMLDDGIINHNNSLPPSNSEEGGPLISLKNYFGALSEKGVTYSTFVLEESKSRAGSEAFPEGGEAEDTTRQVSGTKIGIPGARVRFV